MAHNLTTTRNGNLRTIIETEDGEVRIVESPAGLIAMSVDPGHATLLTRDQAESIINTLQMALADQKG